MSKPDFTEWLGDRDGPFIRLTNTGEMIDWVGQGLGGNQITKLLEDVERHCLEYSVDPVADMDMLCVALRDPMTEPWTITVGASYRSAIPDFDVLIEFSPIVKDTRGMTPAPE